MSEEKHGCLKVIGVIIAAFAGAFLAFYFVVNTTITRLMNPEYQMRRMERMMEHQERNFRKMEAKMIEHPFEEKAFPVLTRFAKEPDAYRITLDLKALNNDEKNVNVELKDNILSISGAADKKDKHKERSINFSQSFYLDGNLKNDGITKEKDGDKYIITVPYEG